MRHRRRLASRVSASAIVCITETSPSPFKCDGYGLAGIDLPGESAPRARALFWAILRETFGSPGGRPGTAQCQEVRKTAISRSWKQPERATLSAINRREFLIGLGMFAASTRLALSAASQIFEEIPANRSGIVWTHENAMSPEHYLPETLGPGCALLDYDNDGWMDIYLVNSGPSEFYQPHK